MPLAGEEATFEAARCFVVLGLLLFLATAALLGGRGGRLGEGDAADFGLGLKVTSLLFDLLVVDRTGVPSFPPIECAWSCTFSIGSDSFFAFPFLKRLLFLLLLCLN